MRVAIILAAVLFGASAWVTSAASAAESVIRVTLLGSGSPIPLPDRFGPATLVEAGNQTLLFDAGRGATIRLYQSGVRIGGVDPLFITHLHSDHVSGIPDVWLTGWLGAPWGRRTTPLHVIGPTGTKDLMLNLEKAYAADIRIRIADEKYPPEGIAVLTKEFDSDGTIYEKDGVRVTAFEVDHGEQIKPAYGYRIDYRGRSVTLSGDTRFNQNVIKYGTGADLLLHEVYAARREMQNEPQVQRVMAHHTSPQQAGEVFSAAHPGLAAYTHIVLGARPNSPALTIPELVAQTRETYGGPLEVGEDLMVFEIGADGRVEVKRHALSH